MDLPAQRDNVRSKHRLIAELTDARRAIDVTDGGTMENAELPLESDLRSLLSHELENIRIHAGIHLGDILGRNLRCSAEVPHGVDRRVAHDSAGVRLQAILPELPSLAQLKRGARGIHSGRKDGP